MVLELIFTIAIFVIFAYVFVRILHSIVLGAVLIIVVLVASYLLVGVFPDLKLLPFIGSFFDFPITIAGVLFNIDVLDASRDSENNLLITVTNAGLFDIDGFKVYVDTQNTTILNNPKDPLRFKETTTIEIDWKGNFTSIIVETNQAKAIYKQ